MTIIRQETTIIPHTLEGRLLADEYEQKLRAQGCFRKRFEDTVYITIKAEYTLAVKDGE